MATLNEDGYFPDTQGERKQDLDSGMLATFPAQGTEFLDLTPDSFTGRTNTVMSEALVSSENLTADFIDLLDPGQATGPFVDYHLRLQGTRRKRATASTIPALLAGIPGTLVGDKRVRFIPNATLWRTPQFDSAGDPLVISPNGFLETVLTATVTGPLDAIETGTSSWLIVDQVVGWDATTGSIESTSSVTLGSVVESDSAGRVRLALPSTAALGVATAPGVLKRLNAIDGVTDAAINNNRTLAPVNGVPMKSIEAIVEGGDPQAIVNTILAVYQGTAGFFGTTTLTATASFARLDGTIITLTETVSFTRPEKVAAIGEYTVTYGEPTKAPEDGGVAIIRATAAAYINTAGRGVDVVPTASASAAVAALPPESEPFIVGLVALKGDAPAAAPIPISVRQRGATNSAAQAAIITGTQVETFAFIVTWVLVLSVDNGAPVSVTFSETDFAIIGAARASEVAAVIGAQVSTLDAGVDEGAVQLTSKTIGAAASIEITNASSVALLNELGFSLGTTQGSDSDITVVIA